MNEKDREVIYINGEPVYDADHYKPGKKQKPMRGSKKCKHCGALLPSNASYCDVCGQPCDDTISAAENARREEVRHGTRKIGKGCLIIFVSFIALAILASLLFAFIDESRDKYYGQGEPKDWKNYVTAEQYEKVKYGMTYEEVSKILGEGVLEISLDGGEHLVYFWPGEKWTETEDGRLFETYVEISFTGGRMLSMEEQNVLRMDETRAAFDAGAENLDAPSVTKDIAHKVEEGMDLSHVSSILGGKGALMEERTYQSSPGRKSVYESYGWRCIKFDEPDIFEVRFDDGKVDYLYLSDYME